MYRSTPSPRACVRLALVALSAVALTRCAEPSIASPASPLVPATPRADIGPSPSAPIGSEYSWERGQPAVWMGALAGRACFLTYVGGRFDGVTDWVAVTGNFGGWYLSGASASGGSWAVSARARCFAVTAYSAEKTLTLTPSSPAPADAVLLGAGACGLTRVGGKLASGDGVGITDAVSNPALWINSQTWDHNTASARCVTTPGIVHTVDKSWKFADPTVAIAGLSSVDFCVLGRVEGPFRLASHWVHLSKSMWGWWLGGSGQAYTRANADCFEA
jgi:hypothetical protein